MRRRLLRKLDRAGALSAGDWRRLLQAWFLLLAVDLGLRLLPFCRLQGLLEKGRAGRSTPAADETQTAIQRTHRLVDIAARHHLYPMTCLRRSLALQRLLAGQGIITELRFGARREDGVLSAHAWLEHDGQPIGEPEALTGRFAALGAVRPPG